MASSIPIKYELFSEKYLINRRSPIKYYHIDPEWILVMKRYPTIFRSLE